ncbi:MAG: ABC transporter substrate-binding protein [Actinomycetota bacterium]|nr:ABC transporter substrate-binding protein [Actinomycetota bacterium]
MLRLTGRFVAVVAAVTLAAAACSSSSKPSAGGSGNNGSTVPTTTGQSLTSVKVGVLADLTGAGAVTGNSTVPGIKAGVGLARTEGYNVSYVLADTQSTPAGVLAAAQRLVEQDHVFAVIMISQLGFGAAQYLTSHAIPVIGINVDGSEWLTAKNMFSVYGYADYSKVITTYGTIFKQLGGTVFGGAAYSIAPASYLNNKSAAASAKLAGLKVGYDNTQLAYGTTNVGPVVLAMKNAGVDFVYPSIAQASSFAIVQGLEQAGVKFKALLPTGYGGDLTDAGPGSSHSAQNVYFTNIYEPVEMHTAATQRLVDALKTYAGVTTEPTLNEYSGYLSIDALVQGLKAAGANATPAQFINTMLGITDYSAQGLFGGKTISFALQGRGSIFGAGDCTYVVQYQGTTFHLVQGMEPICGTTVPDMTVTGP